MGREVGGIHAYLRKVSLFVPFRPLRSWMRPVCIGEGNPLHSVYQFKRQPHPETPKILFDQYLGTPRPTQLDTKCTITTPLPRFP